MLPIADSLRWRLRRWSDSYRPFAALAVGLLVLAAGLFVAERLQLQPAITAARSERDAVNEQLGKALETPRRSITTTLPSTDASRAFDRDEIATLTTQAKTAGLERVRTAAERRSGDGAILSVSVQAQGSYAQVKDFLRTALADPDRLAASEVSLRAADGGRVEMRLSVVRAVRGSGN